MIELLLASLLTCTEAEELIEDLNNNRMENKEELIQVIKENSTSGCYEGSERNS